VPFVPFDLASLAFGALDFRAKSVALATLLGALPEAYLFAKLVDPNETLLDSTLISLAVLGVCLVVPLVIFEYLGRKNGTGMWQTLRAMYREIHYEVQSNNDIVKRQTFDNTKTPVLLLYGFFSSRRAVTVLERMLTTRGHQVLSFNLGGLMGTFFTRDILETANFIDYKIKRQIERHGFKNIHVVAHSKGGMVALWWALKLGGAKYCDKVITMGTPFNGSILTYLALVTPLGFFWRDVGQMRPGSMFLKSLNDAEVPEGLKIFCLHSTKDRVANGRAGIFRPRRPSPNIVSVPMNHISHFEFLYRRDVGETISRLLSGEAVAGATQAPAASQVALSDAPVSIEAQAIGKTS
jgi:pimeloyl-ACP methyl ester carboxylesterase